MTTLPSDFKQRETVLVVDDDPDYRLFIATIFEGLGYEALTAKDGKDALNVAVMHMQTALRATWSDIAMPRMDGVDLARTLQVIEPKAVIILASGSLEKSGYTLEDIRSVTPHYMEKQGDRAAIRAFIRSILSE